MKRASARWGSPSYAMKELRTIMRQWAKARRAALTAPPSTWALEHDKNIAFGKVLGVSSALLAVGALSHAQYERCHRRMDRIISAKVARRPFSEWRSAA